MMLFTCDTDHGLVMGMDVVGVSHDFHISRNLNLNGVSLMKWYLDVCV